MGQAGDWFVDHTTDLVSSDACALAWDVDPPVDPNAPTTRPPQLDSAFGVGDDLWLLQAVPSEADEGSPFGPSSTWGNWQQASRVRSSANSSLQMTALDVPSPTDPGGRDSFVGWPLEEGFLLFGGSGGTRGRVDLDSDGHDIDVDHVRLLDDMWLFSYPGAQASAISGAALPAACGDNPFTVVLHRDAVSGYGLELANDNAQILNWARAVGEYKPGVAERA